MGCGNAHVQFIATRKLWRCKEYKRQFTDKVGTIFEDSPISFSKWLPAVWLLANTKNGTSSHELGRALGVTQKTAWFMLHRIRVAMRLWCAKYIGADAAARAASSWRYCGPSRRRWAARSRSIGAGVLAEIALAAIPVLVAISTANKARFIGPQTAFANGATTIFDRLIGYHISTGSMNPARTLGPLLLLGGSPDWWVFVFGPLLGAALAVWLTWLIHGGPNEQESHQSHG